MRIISRNDLKDTPKSAAEFSTLPWNLHEREAAFFYEKMGFKVIRLEHFVSGFVGTKEHLSKESEILGGHLRRFFSKHDYERYVYRHSSVSKYLTLDGVDPKDYALAFYPPDFLVVDKKTLRWKFVEVKGPKDRLHFRQANWYINLMPASWEYEIFASIDRDLESPVLFLPDEKKKSANAFHSLYEEKLKQVHKHREFLEKIKSRYRP